MSWTGELGYMALLAAGLMLPTSTRNVWSPQDMRERVLAFFVGTWIGIFILHFLGLMP